MTTPNVEPSAAAGSADVPTQRLHIFSVLLGWVQALTRSVIPLAVLFLQHRERGGRLLPIIGGVILLLTAAWSVASYLATRYGLSRDALVVRSGVLRRQSRVIPFGRIQSVNVRQSALQRLFGMAEVRVETATTGTDSEAELSVLRWSEAQALRELLVAERRTALLGAASARAVSESAAVGLDATRTPGANEASVAGTTPRVAADSAFADPPAAVPIASISVEELMVAGGTSNNIGVLIALLISGCERFGSSFVERIMLPGALGSPIEAMTSAMSSVWVFMTLLLLVVIPILFASWLVSVAGSVVRYYGFTLERVGQDLRRKHGLFSRMEASVPLARAQAIRFRQSILRRPFQRGELFLISAGSATGSDGASAGAQHLMPIIRVEHVPSLVAEVFPDAAVGAALAEVRGGEHWRRASLVSWVRLGLSSMLWLAVVIAVMVWWRGDSWWALAWWLPFAWALAGLRWRVRGISLVPGYVLVREGGISRTTMIMPERKLQLVEVHQGPLQRLFGVATLYLTTAGTGGSASMVDLPLAQARSLQDDLAARLPRTVKRTPRVPAATESHPPIMERLMYGR